MPLLSTNRVDLVLQNAQMLVDLCFFTIMPHDPGAYFGAGFCALRESLTSFRLPAATLSGTISLLGVVPMKHRSTLCARSIGITFSYDVGALVRAESLCSEILVEWSPAPFARNIGTPLPPACRSRITVSGTEPSPLIRGNELLPTPLTETRQDRRTTGFVDAGGPHYGDHDR